jgi:UDP-N-acetylglucosamine 2-epimerase
MYYSSLGHELYLSCMAYVNGVVGNSSSGIIEAPAFKTGIINIGERQKGRVQSNSVINSKSNCESITKSLKILFSIEYKNSLKNSTNPYYVKNSSMKIINVLKKVNIEKLNSKKFYKVRND